MKHTTKLLALVLVLALAFGMTSIVSAETYDVPGADTIDLSKEVALQTWIIGDTAPDKDLVYEKINGVLKEKLNTTIELHYIPWSDAGTRYQLLFAGGEDFDQCYTAFWTSPGYKQLAVQGAFMPLTEEMLTTYAPKAYAQLSDAAIKQNLVDGVLYTFPKSGRAYDYKTVVMIRGDLREKYGLDEVKTLDDLNNYLHVIAENEEGMVPYQVEGDGSMIMSVFYTQANNIERLSTANVVVDIDDDMSDHDKEYILMVDDPRFRDFCVMMKDWRDSGIIPSDALSQTATSGQGAAFTSGRSAMFAWNVNILNAYNTTMAEHPEWKPEIIDVADFDGALSFPTPFRDGIAINPESENWQRCLMVQELIRNDQQLYDWFQFGLEGIHWNPVGDDKYELLPASGNFPANSSFQWGIVTDMQRTSVTYPQSYIDIEQHWKDTHYDYVMNGFTMDTTKVAPIQAVLSTLWDEYYKPLSLGAVDDIDAFIAEWKAKMEQAGLDQYVAEAMNQIFAYADMMR